MTTSGLTRSAIHVVLSSFLFLILFLTPFLTLQSNSSATSNHSLSLSHVMSVHTHVRPSVRCFLIPPLMCTYSSQLIIFLFAYQSYSTAIDLDDTNAEYYVKRATAYLKLGQHAEAVGDAKSAIQSAPEMGRAQLRLGQAYHGLKDTAQALKALSKATVRILSTPQPPPIF